MEPNRKSWNERQKTLRQALSRPGEHQQAITLFLMQHAMVHSAQMSQSGLFSFEDEVWEGLSAGQLRRTPPRQDHSIAWLVWHITRIEDITMNLLVAGRPQIFWREAWQPRLKITPVDAGNATQEAEIARLSAAIDLEALRAYRLAVGRSTREIAQNLKPEELKTKVDPARLAQVSAQGAIGTASQVILDYWGGLTTAGLLLMPPTRHSLIHLNEALRVRQTLR